MTVEHLSPPTGATPVDEHVIGWSAKGGTAPFSGGNGAVAPEKSHAQFGIG